MNSAWGSRAEILKYFGWTYDYLLWGISWMNVSVMLADGARYESDGDGDGEEKDDKGGKIVRRELKGKKAILDYINGII